MQEAIKIIMEAEKEASKNISEAQKKANDMINKNNSEITEKLNTIRENEMIRFNQVVADAEKEHKSRLEKIKQNNSSFEINIVSIADMVFKRILKTIFD